MENKRDYSILGSTQILRALGYTPQQLDFVGRIYALEQHKEVIKKIEISQLTTTSGLLGELWVIGEPRKIGLRVQLQSLLGFKDDSGLHAELMKRVSGALKEEGIDPTSLFAYCNRSYGIENDNLRVDVGFTDR